MSSRSMLALRVNKSTTITAACSCDENGCSVSGYMQHGCWNCGMPGGPICP